MARSADDLDLREFMPSGGDDMDLRKFMPSGEDDMDLRSFMPDDTPVQSSDGRRFLVSDADTIVELDNEGRAAGTYRLADINASESGSQLAAVQKRRLREELSKGFTLQTRGDADHYGRSIADVVDADGQSITQRMLSEGYVHQYPTANPSLAAQQANRKYLMGDVPDEVKQAGTPRYKSKNKVRDPHSDDDFLRGLAQGINQVQGAVGGLVSIAGELTENEGLQQYGEEVMNRNFAQAQTRRPRVGSVSQIDDVGDAIDFAQGALGQAVPSMLPGLIGGGVGGVVAGRIGAVGGVAASSIGQEAGIIQHELHGAGLRSPETALAFGAAAGLLDAAPQVYLLNKLFPGVGKELSKGFVKSFMQSAGIQIPSEGATEAMQEVIELAAVAYHDPSVDLSSPQAIDQYLTAAAAGAVVGGVAGGAVGVVDALRATDTTEETDDGEGDTETGGDGGAVDVLGGVRSGPGVGEDGGAAGQETEVEEPPAQPVEEPPAQPVEAIGPSEEPLVVTGEEETIGPFLGQRPADWRGPIPTGGGTVDVPGGVRSEAAGQETEVEAPPAQPVEAPPAQPVEEPPAQRGPTSIISEEDEQAIDDEMGFASQGGLNEEGYVVQSDEELKLVETIKKALSEFQLQPEDMAHLYMVLRGEEQPESDVIREAAQYVWEQLKTLSKEPAHEELLDEQQVWTDHTRGYIPRSQFVEEMMLEEERASVDQFYEDQAAEEGVEKKRYDRSRFLLPLYREDGSSIEVHTGVLARLGRRLVDAGGELEGTKGLVAGLAEALTEYSKRGWQLTPPVDGTPEQQQQALDYIEERGKQTTNAIVVRERETKKPAKAQRQELEQLRGLWRGVKQGDEASIRRVLQLEAQQNLLRRTVKLTKRGQVTRVEDAARGQLKNVEEPEFYSPEATELNALGRVREALQKAYKRRRKKGKSEWATIKEILSSNASLLHMSGLSYAQEALKRAEKSGDRAGMARQQRNVAQANQKHKMLKRIQKWVRDNDDGVQGAKGFADLLDRMEDDLAVAVEQQRDEFEAKRDRLNYGISGVEEMRDELDSQVEKAELENQLNEERKQQAQTKDRLRQAGFEASQREKNRTRILARPPEEMKKGVRQQYEVLIDSVREMVDTLRSDLGIYNRITIVTPANASSIPHAGARALIENEGDKIGGLAIPVKNKQDGKMEFYIYVKQLANTRVLMHELGHVVHAVYWDNLSPTMQKKLKDAYDKQPNDVVSFAEWMADQLVAWSRKPNTKANNAIESFFKRVGEALRKLWDKYVNHKRFELNETYDEFISAVAGLYTASPGIKYDNEFLRDLVNARGEGFAPLDFSAWHPTPEERERLKEARGFDVQNYRQPVQAFTPPSDVLKKATDKVFAKSREKVTRDATGPYASLIHGLSSLGTGFVALHDMVTASLDGRMGRLAKRIEFRAKQQGGRHQEFFDQGNDNPVTRIMRQWWHPPGYIVPEGDQKLTLSQGRETNERRFVGMVRSSLIKLTAEERTELYNLLRNPNTETSNPAVKQAAANIREMFDDMYEYMRNAGLPLRKKENYLPVQLKNEELLKPERRAEFIGNLVEYEEFTEQAANEFVDNLSDYIKELAIEGNQKEFAGMSSQSFLKARKFYEKLNNPGWYESFIETDITEIVNNYIHKAVGAAEYNKRFGEPAELNGDGTIKNWDPKAQWRAWIEQAWMAGATAKEIEFLHEAHNAAIGRVGLDTPKALRDLFGGIMLYQNVRLLLFATLASLQDVVGPSIRAGDTKYLWQTLKEVTQGVYFQKEAYEMGRALGVVNDVYNDHILSEGFENHYTSNWARQANEKYFKLIGLKQWTNFTRAAAARVGIQSLIDYAQLSKQSGPRAKFAREWLKELGLTARDVELWQENGQLIYGRDGLTIEAYQRGNRRPGVNMAQLKNAQKIGETLVKFVDSSIMRPTASQRPLWASHPKGMLFWHLKSFMYSFMMTTMARIGHNMNGTNVTEAQVRALAAAMMLLPLAALNLEIRELLQYGTGESHYDRMSTPEYLLTVVARAGLLGPSQLAFDTYSAEERGKIGLISAFGGPQLDQIQLALITAGDDDAWAKTLGKATPVFSQFPWLRGLVDDTFRD